MPRKYRPQQYLIQAAIQSKNEINSMRKHNFSSFLLTVIYAVGLFFLFFNLVPNFILLTPITLFISLCIVLYAHPEINKKLFLFIFICFLIGLTIEIVGTQTGFIFGDYKYGKTLGPTINNVPWIIGINWALLSYCCGVTVIKIAPKLNFWLRSFLGALLLVSLDILIEPVAMIYDFWHWGENNIVPLQNYFAWFIISFILL